MIWTLAVVTGLLFFSALIAHELSHAAVAKAYGLPVRSITLFARGGVAHIEREAAAPKVEFWMGIVGLITPHEVKEVEREWRPHTTVEKAMRPLDQLRTVRPETPITEALETMGCQDVSQLPVVAGGRLAGVISRGHIVQLLQARASWSCEHSRNRVAGEIGPTGDTRTKPQPGVAATALQSGIGSRQLWWSSKGAVPRRSHAE